MREGGEPKHEVAIYLEGQPHGGGENQSGMRTWSQALWTLRGEVLLGDGKFSTSLTEVGKQHNDLWIW